eukprot:TRINITY_DN7770_c0_g1_i1.p1 TRINITY_DN7770_c0_g1~~TRINITY_DN7770_c0_g1_i1.p1  ORF type:complete len:258 (+),score=58.28 TRINITY_DN7770_c0_g1_i1:32-805(+)
MKIKEHTFIVTGGASGLGKSTVELLISLGGNVVILDRDIQGGLILQKEMGDSCLFIECDIVSEQSVLDAIKLIKAKFGNIHGVVNAAGVGWASKIASKKMGPHDLEIFKKVIEINLIGTFNVNRLVAFEMINQNKIDEDGQRGVIINVASVAAYDGQNGQVAYSASKGAVVSMTLVSSRDLANDGIRTVCIAPGSFDTPMMSKANEKVKKGLVEVTPFPKRFGNPNEFAFLVAHIFQNNFLNGTTIRLDGGSRLPML